MRFKSVRATAFGCLKEKTLEFAPGFTVVYGLNEAGKSTWHAAMYSALCGIRRGQGATKPEREFRERYMPWSGGRWEVGAAIELDNGDLINLRHDLEGKVDCRAVDATTGRDISAKLTFEGMPDASLLLGLNRKLYQHVACIRQADILSILDDQAGLQAQLQQTLASPDAKQTAAAALANLSAFKADHVGQARANAVKPLAVASRQLETARTSLDAARASHNEYAVMLADAARLRSQANDLAARRDLLHARILLDEAKESAATLERMRDLAARNPAPPPDRGDEAAFALRVSAALNAYDQRPTIAELEGETAEELRQQIAALPDPPSGDTAPHESVVNAERAWREARTRLEQHASGKPAEPQSTGTANDAYELRVLAGILRQPTPPIPVELEAAAAHARERVVNASEAGRRNKLFFGAGAALAVAGLLVTLLGFLPGIVALLAGLALAGAGFISRPSAPLWKLIQEQAEAESSLATATDERARIAAAREKAANNARQLGLVPDPEALLRHAEAISRDIGLAESLATWQLQHEQLITAETRASNGLREALALRGATADATPEAGLKQYAEACEARARQMAESGKRAALGARLEYRQSQEAAASEARQQLEAVLGALRLVAERLGEAGEPLEQANALRDWLRKRESRLAADEVALKEWQELETLRQGGIEDVREQHISELREQAAALDPDGLASSVIPGGNPRQQLAEAQAEATDAATRATNLEARCEQFATSIPSVSEAEEQLEAARERLAEVRALEIVLDRTTDYLKRAEESVQRNIAPILTQSVAPRLAHVTGGRYAQVAVDPANLNVRVFDNEGAAHYATQLSHGTREQVYLLLRVALAELFARSGESVPLLMDDVTVESDRVRTAAILSVLHELSKSHQIILFTQEDDVLEWAQKHLAGPQDSTIVLQSA